MKLLKRLREKREFKKRSRQILQVATDFWNECEKRIKEHKRYGEKL